MIISHIHFYFCVSHWTTLTHHKMRSNISLWLFFTFYYSYYVQNYLVALGTTGQLPDILLMVALDIFCSVYICMNKWSIGKHKFSQDWNDILLAFTSRIKSLIFTFFTEKFDFQCWNWRIWIKKSWLKILNTYSSFLDPFWCLFHSCHMWMWNSILR